MYSVIAGRSVKSTWNCLAKEAGSRSISSWSFGKVFVALGLMFSYSFCFLGDSLSKVCFDGSLTMGLLAGLAGLVGFELSVLSSLEGSGLQTGVRSSSSDYFFSLTCKGFSLASFSRFFCSYARIMWGLMKGFFFGFATGVLGPPPDIWKKLKTSFCGFLKQKEFRELRLIGEK